MPDNFSLSRAVAISYGNVSGVESPADRLRRNVTALLKAQGKTQADLAKYVGRSRPWISQILSGRRATTLSTLQQIQEFFGSDVEDLFARPTKVTYPDRPRGVNSPSHLSEGASHGAEISSLKQQLADQQAKTRRLSKEGGDFAKQVGIAASQFADLATKVAAVMAAGAGAGEDDRGDDRQVSRERKRRGRA